MKRGTGMTVQMLSRADSKETAVETLVAPAGLDMDVIDSALDRGDLETVRQLLDISPDAWRLLLAKL